MRTFLRKSSLKRGFYFLCFFVLCICDQQIGSASGEMQLVCPNLVLCVLSCVILSHYPLSKYRRPLFWILLLPCVAGACLGFWLKWPATNYPFQLISGVIAAVLYCCVIIQTGFAIQLGKGIPRGRHPGIGLMGLLLFFILISNHDKYNGALLCLSILLIYLTDFTALEFEWMIKALASAVIAAFFVFQGLAFVFRPYDTLRYLGMYANTNMNALLYQMAYAVFLAFFCMAEGRRSSFVLRWGSFCFACAMWSFVLLTMCRSAMLGMGVATLLGLGITVWKQRGKRIRKCLVYCGSFMLISVLAFPIVYGAVRYLPPVFHHPIWFMDEYSEDKVHSWDPYDSEKYTDWREVLENNFGRLFPDMISRQSAPCVEPEPFLPGEDGGILAAASVGRASLPSREASGRDSSEAGPPVEREESDKTYSVNARLRIYQYYFSQLNLRGHIDSENGIQVDQDYFAPHAHNIILQYAFNYGVPAGLMLLVYMIASGLRLFLSSLREEGDFPFLVVLLLFASIAAFGMTEMAWRFGQLSHTFVLLLPCFAWMQTRAVAPYKSRVPADEDSSTDGHAYPVKGAW